MLIGGGFYQYNDTPRDRIARLNPDGSLYPTFNLKKISDGLILDGVIHEIVLQPDGKILIGGWFTLLYSKTFSLFGISFKII
jgi:hypothetical protein